MIMKYTKIILLFLTIQNAMRVIDALELEMQFMTKCVMEQFPSNIQVTLEYKAYKKENNQPVSVKIQVDSPNGKTIQASKNSDDRIVYKTTSEGMYKACFTAPRDKEGYKTRVHINWRVSESSSSSNISQDWEDVAKKEHLNDVHSQLERVREVAKDIQDQMMSMRKLEEKMRDLNEGTNTRVAYFSLFCVIVCLTIAAGQVWYLRRFFIKKKII